MFTKLAPKVFAVAFAMMKPLMHERTRNKINIYSHDEKTWKAALLAEINPDQLPKMYGGTMTDPDGNPSCITKVHYKYINILLAVAAITFSAINKIEHSM
jgi:metal transporter CNNM